MQPRLRSKSQIFTGAQTSKRTPARQEMEMQQKKHRLRTNEPEMTKRKPNSEARHFYFRNFDNVCSLCETGKPRRGSVYTPALPGLFMLHTGFPRETVVDLQRAQGLVST